MDSKYHSKYLKYKIKYLEIKKLIGGTSISENIEHTPSGNIEHNPAENTEHNPAENIEHNPAENIEHNPAENIDHKPVENIEHTPSEKNINNVDDENNINIINSYILNPTLLKEGRLEYGPSAVRLMKYIDGNNSEVASLQSNFPYNKICFILNRGDTSENITLTTDYSNLLWEGQLDKLRNLSSEDITIFKKLVDAFYDYININGNKILRIKNMCNDL